MHCMNELPNTIEDITLFYLNSNAPKNLKNYVSKLAKKAATPRLTTIELVDTLLDIYKLRHAWQKQVYCINHSEQASLLHQGLMRMLFPNQIAEFLNENTIHEDDEFIVFFTDSTIKMLRDIISAEVVLKDLYLFLLENQFLPGFLLVSKKFYAELVF